MNISGCNSLIDVTEFVCYLCSEPLQYILGEWDFEDIELKMKPPVFIPRAETEVCVFTV